jgi:hypothetical protein
VYVYIPWKEHTFMYMTAVLVVSSMYRTAVLVVSSMYRTAVLVVSSMYRTARTHVDVRDDKWAEQ